MGVTMLESSELRPGLLQGLHREGQETEAPRDGSHGRTTQAYWLQSIKDTEREASRRARVDLVHLVCLVHLVSLVYPVSLVQPNKRDKPNKPEQPAGSRASRATIHGRR